MPSGDRQRKDVQFRIFEVGDTVNLAELKASAKGLGQGSSFMHWFTNAADLHSVTLELNAAADTPDKQEALEAMYMEFGFRFEDDYSNIMVREPRKPFTMPDDYDGPALEDFM